MKYSRRRSDSMENEYEYKHTTTTLFLPVLIEWSNFLAICLMICIANENGIVNKIEKSITILILCAFWIVYMFYYKKDLFSRSQKTQFNVIFCLGTPVLVFYCILTF